MKFSPFIYCLGALALLAGVDRAAAAETTVDVAQPAPSTRAAAPSTGSTEPRFNIQPEIGFLSSTVADQNGWGSNSASGFSLGALTEFGRGLISFQTGLQYMQLGGKIEGTGGTGSGTEKDQLKLDYLGIPLLAKLNFSGDRSKAVFFVRAGLIPALLTAREASISDDNGSAKTGDVRIKWTDLLTVLGIGGSIHVTPKNSLVIEASYLKSAADISTGSGEVYNRSLTLNLGYSFGID